MRKMSTHFRTLISGSVFTLLMLLMSSVVFGQLKRPEQSQKKQLGISEISSFKKSADVPADDPSVIYLNAKKINALSAASQNARKSVVPFAGKHMHMLKFSGPIQPEWYKMITDAGAEVVDYIPNYTYIVFGDYTSLMGLQGEARKTGSSIVWDGEYLPEYRVSPTVYEGGTAGTPNVNKVIYQRFQVQLYNNEETNAATRQLMNSLKIIGTPVYEQKISRYVNITLSLTPDGLKAISERPDVISIYPWIEPARNDEAQDMIMTGQLSGNSPVPGNYLTWLAGKGLTEAQFNTSGFAVNITDGGLDNGQASAGGPPNPTFHFALFRNGDNTLASRVLFIHAQGSATLTDTKGCEGHGNINTHIVGGYIPDALLGNSNHTDANNFRYGLGVAPFVKLGNSTIFNAGGSYTNPVLNNVEAESYRDGGRISTNSWGANVGGAYNASAQNYDFLVRDAQPASSSVPAAGNQEMVIFFSAGNAGSGAGTIGSPGTGKNVITVGATENVRAFGGADQCGITDADANSANDIIFFSSRGPCTDGRTKPDIVAPGTHVTGGVYPSSASNPQSGSGTANACFTASGVCAGPGGSDFFPTTQQWTTASSGTSHSTPATAGFGALIRQDFINRALTPASPAMTKAMILTSASWMNGAGAGDNLFSNNQGMGRVNMSNYFDVMTNPNLIRDQVPGDMFTASAQTRTFAGIVANASQPLRVTLAWTDAPGPTSGNAYVNNLDLEVTVNGTLYRGNVFSGAFSTTGGAADTRNNVESVLLPAGTTGTVSITVRATNIAGDGVPNVGGALDQDFALVAGNFTQSAVPVIAAAGATLIAESCAPANGVIDPGETVTVSLCLQNTGTANTGASVVGTLLTAGGVTSPSGAQNYGTLVAGGASVCRNFTFSNSSSICGSTITAQLQVQDGATNLGTVNYVFTLGTTATSFTENFDGVAAPNLPAGWTATNAQGAAPLWTTTASAPVVSAPNVAVIDDPSSLSDKLLTTPSFVPGTGAKLNFSHNFALESGFDGAVLEISINGGAYQDILAAGGSFVTGGYTGTISSSFSSPIAGRSAWTGSSSGFVGVTVNMPASSAGQTTRLRFRMASDVSVGSTGWRIDNITISQPACCGSACTITCPANITVNSSAGACGANVTLPAATTSGLCGPVTYTPASGSFFPVGTTTVTASTAAGPSCTFTVTVVDATAPTITCPANITVSNAAGICGANVSYPFPSVSDNCALPAGTAVPLTQSTDNTTIVPIQIGCQYFGGQTAENSWWRAYNLAPLNLPTTSLNITSVRMGVERITASGTVPVTVRIYTSSGAFPTGTLTLRGTQLVNLPSQTNTIVTVPFSTPVQVPANAIVVVEVNVPDLPVRQCRLLPGQQ
ncbi:MAG: S8 family serine peptidase [Chitinophagaceae bacterium]